MRLYKHNKSTEVIELVGVGHDDLICRWVGWEFKQAFFSITKKDFKNNYVKLPKKPLTAEPSLVSSKSINNF